MKNGRLGIFVLAGCLLTSAVLADLEYKGQGGWRTSDGQGGWTQNDRGENHFDIGIDACKQACENDNACKGVEYFSNPAGWEENGMFVTNKCEIHHDPYQHCDSNVGGRGSAADGCWVKKPHVDVPVLPIGTEKPLPNDTGINKRSTFGSLPLQEDFKSGRDFIANDGSDGHAGFSFSKIGADGGILAVQNGTWDKNGSEVAGTHWSCVQDNVTALMWEVKTNDGGLRGMNHSYAWYEPDNSKNGGDPGKQGDVGVCGLPAAVKCNTWEYVKRVNQVGLCGKKDWRMPTAEELNSIVNFGRRAPTIDDNYFPNTAPFFHWSADTTPDARNNWLGSAAAGTGFMDGWSGATPKQNTGNKSVRLVRGK